MVAVKIEEVDVGPDGAFGPPGAEDRDGDVDSLMTRAASAHDAARAAKARSSHTRNIAAKPGCAHLPRGNEASAGGQPPALLSLEGQKAREGTALGVCLGLG